MAKPVSYFNGDFVPDSECRIRYISDRGFRRGDTIYDVSRTFGGRVHRLGEHLDRLFRSLKYSRIEPGMNQDEMEEVTHEVIRRNPPPDGGDCVVWHTLVRGYAPSPARINTPTPATLCIQVKPIEFRDFAHQYNDGVPVIFPRTRSYPSNSLEPKLKHYSRMNFSMAELEATDLDSEAQAVLLDIDGNISENTSGNFFIVTDGVIRTPSDRSILQGVSRLDIFDLAKGLGIPVSEEDLQPLRRLHRRRGVPHEYHILRPARLPHRQPHLGHRSPRPSGATHPSRMERDGRRGHRGPSPTPSGREGPLGTHGPTSLQPNASSPRWRPSA